MLHANKVLLATALVTLTFAVPGRLCAQNAMQKMPPGVTTKALPDGKTVLVDSKMMTLYTYARDTVAGKSVCSGRCADNWPALVAAANAMAMGDWTIATASDGSKVWAYKGKPLYTFKRDEKPGDANGEGVANGAWHVATP